MMSQTEYLVAIVKAGHDIIESLMILVFAPDNNPIRS